MVREPSIYPIPFGIFFFLNWNWNLNLVDLISLTVSATASSKGAKGDYQQNNHPKTPTVKRKRIRHVVRRVEAVFGVYFPMMLSIFGFIPVLFYKREIPWHSLSIRVFCLLLITSSLKIGGFFLFARGAELGSIGMVSVGTTTYPVIPIIAGVLLFKERLSYTQLIGISLLLGSLAVLAAT